eukprot:scaffold1483_cov379-Prasinococcus_capsulatus_cf.AAC.15
MRWVNKEVLSQIKGLATDDPRLAEKLGELAEVGPLRDRSKRSPSPDESTHALCCCPPGRWLEAVVPALAHTVQSGERAEHVVCRIFSGETCFEAAPNSEHRDACMK